MTSITYLPGAPGPTGAICGARLRVELDAVADLHQLVDAIPVGTRVDAWLQIAGSHGRHRYVYLGPAAEGGPRPVPGRLWMAEQPDVGDHGPDGDAWHPVTIHDWWITHLTVHRKENPA